MAPSALSRGVDSRPSPDIATADKLVLAPSPITVNSNEAQPSPAEAISSRNTSRRRPSLSSSVTEPSPHSWNADSLSSRISSCRHGVVNTDNRRTTTIVVVGELYSGVNTFSSSDGFGPLVFQPAISTLIDGGAVHGGEVDARGGALEDAGEEMSGVVVGSLVGQGALGGAGVPTCCPDGVGSVTRFWAQAWALGGTRARAAAASSQRRAAWSRTNRSTAPMSRSPSAATVVGCAHRLCGTLAKPLP